MTVTNMYQYTNNSEQHIYMNYSLNTLWNHMVALQCVCLIPHIIIYSCTYTL